MALFSRRHYETLAKVIQRTIEMTPVIQGNPLVAFTRELVAEFARDNMAFDRQRFFNAIVKEERGEPVS